MPFPAGTWQFVGDGAAFAPLTVEFDVLWRPVGSTTDQTMLTFTHAFVPNATDENDAVMYDDSATAVAFGNAGDLLKLTMTVLPNDGGVNAQFVPNGDPTSLGGRFMHLTPPCGCDMESAK